MDVNNPAIVTGVGDPLLRRDPSRPATDVDRLYRAHSTRLVHLAAAITLDRALAEEAMQDAFVGLQRRGGAVLDPVGYLQRSVVNLSISVLRRRRTASRLPMPTAQVTVNPEIDETWSAVAGLHPRERAVVVLRFWLDLSEADIASSLGWPRGTVKSTLHRALDHLRKEFAQ